MPFGENYKINEKNPKNSNIKISGLKKKTRDLREKLKFLFT